MELEGGELEVNPIDHQDQLVQFLAMKFIEQAKNPQPVPQQAQAVPNAGGAVPTAPASQQKPRKDPTTGLTVKPTQSMMDRNQKALQRRTAQDSSMAGGPPPPAFHGGEQLAPFAGDDIVQTPQPGQPQPPQQETGNLEELATQGYNIAQSYQPSVPQVTPEERAKQTAQHGQHETVDPAGVIPPPPSGTPVPPPPGA